MPQCHKCEHNGKKSRACLTCRETDNFPSWTKFIPIDEVKGIHAGLHVLPTYSEDATSTTEAMTESQRYSIAEAMMSLMRLSPKQLKVVSWRYQAELSSNGKPTMDDIGAKLHISKQAVSYHLASAFVLFPALAVLFPHTRITLTKPLINRAAKVRGATVKEDKRGFLELAYE